MIPLLIFFATSVFAQSSDLDAIRKLDQDLPNFNEVKNADEDFAIQRTRGDMEPPIRPVPFEDIKISGHDYGSLRNGTVIRRIDNNKNQTIYKQMFVKNYRQEDEHGFKYLLNKDGTVTYKVYSERVEPIKEELVLHEPPANYTPAPYIVKTFYDEKLSLPPEFTFYAGSVRGDFIKDLFNDPKAGSGSSTQYGLHFSTKWNLPIKAGGVIHYERSNYSLQGGGKVIYTSPSIGPQFKTKDFDWFVIPFRLQAQFRVSPFARATAETINGPGTFKFNSADFLASIEVPFKNRWGEFVLGGYLQNQWLNIKDQKTLVDVKATNKTNKSFGISLAQVFE